jgi:hypothetical protein
VKYAHTTVRGVRVSVDSEGRVMAPDASGCADRLLLGRVERSVSHSREWYAIFANSYGEEDTATDWRSRREAIEELLIRHGLAGPGAR